jgi:Domain of unknown function (DUF4160)
MPTLLIVNGLRFFFYSNENSEPPHVHITKGEASGKIWLEPVIAIAYLYQFTNSEEKLIMETVISNVEEFKKKWNEYFGK